MNQGQTPEYGPESGFPGLGQPGTARPNDGSNAQGSRPPGVELPSITLPKGGGAIRGIGEKFSANPVTGTGSMSVPIAISPGRSGFGPQLSLSYDSGAGNGPFGFGWSLSLPTITRKTDKGLPQYLDSEESDVFILSGSEDLVPVLNEDGTRYEDTDNFPGYVVHRYRPRVEGLFARIERWTKQATGEIHWRSITRDNVTTLYGKDTSSRICDPVATRPSRVFSWLVCESYDDKGNAIVYEYVPDNDDNIEQTHASERNRVHTANRYLKRIKYGNRVSRLVQTDLAQMAWMFEVVFDYDEGHYEDVDLDLNRPDAEQHQFVRAAETPRRGWAARMDPFSSYRSGFELRTHRRCRRVMMFHHFAELGSEPCLVRATAFDYADLDYELPVTTEDELTHQGSTRFASFIRSVTQSGYVRDNDRPIEVRDGVNYVTYLAKSLPPLEFEYSKAVIQDTIRELDTASLENLPVGLDGTSYQWVDLDGEGVAGILTEQAGAWFYKPNLGDGRFGALQTVAAKPSTAALSAGHQQLLDLAGNSQLDLVSLAGPTPGFYERTQDGKWESFRPFRQLPNIAWDDPNLRFIDLDGDGHSDVLITEQDAFTWHPSLAEDGFGPSKRVYTPLDEEVGARLIFSDGTHGIYLADMSGDGLSDLVRICTGEVCYWPNQGYGRFGTKVTLDNSPRFDRQDQFDQSRIRLADIDGSGTTDVIYLAGDGARLYFNQSGNQLSDARLVHGFPRTDSQSSVTTSDLLGNGTACLVCTSPLPGNARRPLTYIDLMGGTKPHLLTKIVNNLGAETRVSYAPSTRFFLEDRRAGNPWITRLPFPVHVIERVESVDLIGRSRFVIRYAYHHGYYDSLEREFRGFGMVEQWDTEEHRDDLAFPDVPWANEDITSWRPPVLTRTWFHTGAPGKEMVTRHLARDYWVPSALRGVEADAAREALRLPDSTMPGGLSETERLEAFRALRGTWLRTEVYSRDCTDWQDVPYSVTEQCVEVRRRQSRGLNRHAVFDVVPSESVTFAYERRPDDPRVSHEIVLEVDRFGGVVRSVSIGYPRWVDRTEPEPEPTLSPTFRTALAHDQSRPHLAATLRRWTNAFADPDVTPDVHRAPLAAGMTVAELTGIAVPDASLLRRAAVSDAWDAAWEATEIPYEEVPVADIDGSGASPAKPSRRIVEEIVLRYRSDDLTTLLPEGKAQPLALPGESYRLALTEGLLTQVLDSLADAAVLAEGGYVQLLGRSGWWIPSARSYFSAGDADPPAVELAQARTHFFAPRRVVDPFGGVSRTDPDPYDLLPLRVGDAVGNQTSSVPDYRVLQPVRVADANGSVTEVAFDALGMVAGDAVIGTTAYSTGDSLVGFDADLDDAAVQAFMDTAGGAAALLGNATTRIVYDRNAFWRTRPKAAPQPLATCAVIRETHVGDALADGGLVHLGFSYSDGFGRQIQSKGEAEPGPVEGGGTLISPRWVGSGWTVYDNKAAPVQVFEPFFSATHRFEFDRSVGVSSVAFRDPLGRTVAALHPDGTWEKTVFNAWRQETWDVIDTASVADPRTDNDVGDALRRHLGDAADAYVSWYDRRKGGMCGETPRQGADEKDAADKTIVWAGTPRVTYLDAAARPCLSVTDTGGVRLPIRVAFDAESKPLAIVDPKGRRVIEFCVREPGGAGDVRYFAGYDVAGTVLSRTGMDGGRRRLVGDVAGRPLRSRDDQGHTFRWRYDALRRPTHVYVTADGVEALVERRVYGERIGGGAQLAGRLFRVYDCGGLSESTRYDVKGNLLESVRQSARVSRGTLDWSALSDLIDPVALDAAATPLLRADERFVATTAYDALDRPVQVVTPHSASLQPNVLRPGYNQAGRLETLDVWVRLATPPTTLLDPATANLHAISAVDYNAKAQRTRLAYGNGTETTWSYDPETSRLQNLMTTRPASYGQGRVVQDLAYTYDAGGNVTRIFDDADLHNVVFFRNQRVEPSADYTYDALNRLTVARGREHLGQTGGALAAAVMPSDTDFPRTRLPAPGDGHAMATYTERYAYDEVGNLLSVVHAVSSSGWTRRYRYTEPSAIDPGQTSNRLTATSLPGDPDGSCSGRYTYNPHGSMTAMPHLASLAWNEWDRLSSTARQALNGPGTPRMTHYVYDSGGTRVRKVTDRSAGPGMDPIAESERLYLGPVEVYRELAPDGSTTLQREALHVGVGSERIALVETRTQGTDPGAAELTRYQHGNHIGSAVLELDGSADVVSYEEYFPYGSTSYQAVRATTETPKRYRYTGRERDEENGLCCHGARYYAPWLGRWTSVDPAGLVDGTNVYAYVGGRPTQLVDPSGRNGKTPLPGLLGNDPKIAQLWEQAVQRVLEPRFHGGSVSANVEAYGKEIDLLIATKGMGSNKAAGTAINYARGTFKALRAQFGKLAKEADYNLTDKQVHHMFDELAQNPREALNTTNLYLTEGHAAVKGSGHSVLHEMTRKQQAGSKNPGIDTLKELRDQGVETEIPEATKNLDPKSAGTQAEGSAVKTKTVAAANEAQVQGGTVAAEAKAQVTTTATELAPTAEGGAATVSRTSRSLAVAGEAAVGLAKLGGRILTVVGAHSEASRTMELEQRYHRSAVNRYSMYGAQFVLSAAAGVLDDALGVATIEIGSAPVIDSWDREGAGPVQHLAGEAVRGLLEWSFQHGW